MNGKLYVVATPIGNLSDLTDRAKSVLDEVDIIAAEDTRVTQKLLNVLDIQNKTISYHKFNENKKSDSIVSDLLEGKNVAIVSDAGTPCISDPGHILVKHAIDNGIEVVGIPGCSAVITALSISGFSYISFSFSGFLPRENKDIKKFIKSLPKDSVTVFFESPKRITKSLKQFCEEMPNAEFCLCNDLTKLHEKIYRGSPHKVLEELENNPNHEKGEYTVVVKSPIEDDSDAQVESISCEALIVDYLVKNESTQKDAIKALLEKHKGVISKKELYAASLRLKEMFFDEDE